jgi:hypothetical protein
MNRWIQIFMATFVAVALASGGGFWVVWTLNAQSMLATFEDWAAERRASGYQVTYDEVIISGFPGTAALTVSGMEVAKPSDSLAWRWIPNQVRIAPGATGAQHLTVSLLGTQTLTYRIGDEIRTAKFTAKRFRLDLRASSDGALDRLAFDLLGFALLRPQEGSPVTARRVLIQVSLGDGAGVLPLSTEAVLLFDTLVLPDHRNGPLGSTIDLFEAKVRLLTRITSFDLPVAIEDWRKRGGKLAVSESRLRWSSLSARANGTLQVDEAFRPTGSLKAQIADFTSSLDAFWAAGRFNTEVMNALLSALADILEVENVGIVPYDIRIEDGLIRVVDILGRKVEGAILGTVAPIFPFPQAPD